MTIGRGADVNPLFLGMNIALCVLYFAVLALLAAYGFHRLQLVILCRVHRKKLNRMVEQAPPPVLGDARCTARGRSAEAATLDVLAADPRDDLHVAVEGGETDEPLRAVSEGYAAYRRARAVDAAAPHDASPSPPEGCMGTKSARASAATSARSRP